MSNKIREYENRYWLVNDDVYELHFTQFYDDEIILKFVQDKDDLENYIYVSSLLNVEHGEILAESVEDAMEQFEDMVVDHIQEQISYYEEMLDKFQGKNDMKYEVKEKLNSFGEKHRLFQPNDIVRHFKGNLYRIITIARNTETKELEVIYESLYPSADDGRRGVWARPYGMFESKVDFDKYPNAMQEYRMEIVEIQDVLV